MISVDRQQKLLLNISRNLKKPITAYAVGGTAMMFHGLKEATLDIDLVFSTAEEKNHFKKAAESLGYYELDAVKIYGTKDNRPDMLTLGDERLDLFINRVIDFGFSENMRRRAVDKHQFGENLTLNIANPHDLIIMKCATDRQKDKDDARSIILDTTIDWKTIIAESEHQIELGRETAVFDLGCFLEDLKKDMKVPVPQETLDILFEFTEKQAEQKKSKH